MKNSRQFTKEETVKILNEKVRIFKRNLELIYEQNRETLIQIRSVSDVNMPNMISRLIRFAEGLAHNQMRNLKDSSEMCKSFVRQYERLDDLENGLKQHRIDCTGFETIRKTFEAIEAATRQIMAMESDVPPLF